MGHFALFEVHTDCHRTLLCRIILLPALLYSFALIRVQTMFIAFRPLLFSYAAKLTERSITVLRVTHVDTLLACYEGSHLVFGDFSKIHAVIPLFEYFKLLAGHLRLA